MRLLHTSDWHLGRSFHREGLLEAQAGFLDHLIEVVVGERVDAVLVSGDVFDRALPSVDAVRLADDALRRLAGRHVRTVMISGNHDSARRLGFAAELIDAAGIHLRTRIEDVGRPVLLGESEERVAVYAVPYLEPDAVREDLGVPAPRDTSEARRSRPGPHAAVMAAAMDRVRADLTRRQGNRSVVMAHAFVTGAEPCESERDITVGGSATMPAEVFSGIDYVALGHLHGAQRVTERVRYSGSPIAYSFSEERHTKGSWLVDLPTRGDPHAEFVPAPVRRPVARLRGRLADLLTEQRYGEHEHSYVQATLTDPIRPPEPMVRLRERFPHALQLLFDPEGGPAAPEASYARRVNGLDDLAVATGFVEHVRGQGVDEAELALLREAFEASRRDTTVPAGR